MKTLLLVLLCGGCVHEPFEGPPPGQVHRAYETIPPYLEHPVAEHDLTPSERVDQMNQLLRDVDTRAGALEASALDAQQPALRDTVDRLKDVVPPKPDLLVPVERMRVVVDAMPGTPPEDTRQRLWALTDLIRLRAQF
jgi:hypothetical protein